MSKELQEMLYTYLGELMHEQSSTFDWIELNKVSEKLNAVYTLLDIEKKEESEMQKMMRFLRQERLTK